jgi:hypothetical protein
MKSNLGDYPAFLETIFMPFKDVIISDGLVRSYNIMISENMANVLWHTWIN